MSDGNKRDRIGIILTGLYILLLAASLLIIGKIVYIQLFFHPPSPPLQKALNPSPDAKILHVVLTEIQISISIHIDERVLSDHSTEPIHDTFL